MTPELLTTWPTAQLRDALGTYRDDYDASQQALITAELERRGASTVGVAPREGVAGFVDSAAASATHAGRTYALASLVCFLVAVVGLWALIRLVRGQYSNPELIVAGAGGLVLGFKFLFDALEQKRLRR